MEKIVECVPNFSEGRDKEKINYIAKAIESVEGVNLLDIDSGEAANRTVITFVGSPDAVEEAAFRAIKAASEVIDMREHHGEHPRIGATDVCPFVPVSGVTMDDCIRIAHRVGRRVGEELGIPVYFYEYAAKKENRRNLAYIRRGEYEGLREKLRDPEWAPDEGPAEFNAKSGATVIGARDFLIAYNVNLNTKDVKIAKKIAKIIREKGYPKRDENGKIVRDENGKAVYVPGKLKYVKAIGWYIEEYGCAQISINLTSYKTTPLYKVYEVCREEAEKLGALVTGSEIVGLVPKEAIIETGKYYLKKQGKSPEIPESDLVDMAVMSLGLNSVSRFDPSEKIIEYRISRNDGLINMKLQDFIDEISRDSPVPGGGSAAALSGAVASGLCSMVANLTANKKDFAEIRDKMIEFAAIGHKYRYNLMKNIDRDTDAFKKIMSAWRLPKKTDEQKEMRKRAIEEATIVAARVPCDTMEASLQVMEMAGDLIEHGNPASVTDVGVAGFLAYAGVMGGAMNVLINLGDIGDENITRDLRDRVDASVRRAEELHGIIGDMIFRRLRGESG